MDQPRAVGCSGRTPGGGVDQPQPRVTSGHCSGKISDSFLTEQFNRLGSVRWLCSICSRNNVGNVDNVGVAVYMGVYSQGGP